jgi:anti-anti-sigma factor
MKISREDLGDVTILRLQGVLNGGSDSQDLRTTVKEILAEGRQKLVVDMERVSWANSVGLGNLHFCYTAIKNSGGFLKLTKVNHRIQQVFQVARFDTIFESYDDVRGAVASFYR